jgi:hypothetical protein
MAAKFFSAWSFAKTADDAIARVSRYVGKVDGFAVTGEARKSGLGQGFDVLVEDLGGDRNDLWVVLSSYGISPDRTLGAHWQSVPGVGRAIA